MNSVFLICEYFVWIVGIIFVGSMLLGKWFDWLADRADAHRRKPRVMTAEEWLQAREDYKNREEK